MEVEYSAQEPYNSTINFSLLITMSGQLNKLRPVNAHFPISMLVLTLCVLSPLTAYSESQNTGKMKHEEMNHGEMKHGEMKHEEMQHGEMNHGEMNHGEMNHGEMNHEEMNHEEMNHGEMNHEEMQHEAHDHKPVDVTNWPATPTLTLTAHKDLMSGWNLHIEPKHFKFAPSNVNTPSRPGEGHAHLYVNGKKITRLYSQWFYLDSLPSGTHSVTISLNANDHGQLVINGKEIATTIELVQD